MPPPSSVMPMRRRPPPSVKMSTWLAPASMAFSTSSLTTLAGRSTTSPAAMRLTSCSGSWRTGMRVWVADSGVGRDPVGRDVPGILRLNIVAFRRPESLAEPSIVVPRGAALGLDVAAALLAFQPPLLRSEGRLGCPARHRPHHGLAQEFEQAVDGIGAVAF